MEIKLGVAKMIDDSILNSCKVAKKRDYMGASGLGEECDRKLWYSYKKPKPVTSARLKRIFDMGNIIEDYLVRIFRDAGLTVYDVMENGDQFGFKDGDIAGHCDGVVVGLPESSKPHLLEFKSAKASSYKAFVKNGVKKENKKYYVQMQIYMNKLNLDRALFVMMNKDTQELYFERVEYDKVCAETFLLRGKEIAKEEEEPERKYPKSTFYKCKWCDWNNECWNQE